MTHVFIAQLVCPKRHAVCAFVFEATEAEIYEKNAQTAIEDHMWELFITIPNVKPQCFICGADKNTWKVEIGKTRFKTVAEAEPHVKACAAANENTRRLVAMRRHAERKASSN